MVADTIWLGNHIPSSAKIGHSGYVFNDFMTAYSSTSLQNQSEKKLAASARALKAALSQTYCAESTIKIDGTAQLQIVRQTDLAHQPVAPQQPTQPSPPK